MDVRMIARFRSNRSGAAGYRLLLNAWRLTVRTEADRIAGVIDQYGSFIWQRYCAICRIILPPNTS
jgi:hypothetical protein